MAMWRHGQGKRHVMMKAEIGVCSCKLKNAQNCQKTTRNWKGQGRILLQLSDGVWSCWHHDFRLLAPRTAAAAKSLQSCPTLCDPIDGSPPGSPVPGILQAKTLEWVAISLSNAWTLEESVLSDSSRPHGLRPTRLLRPWDFPGKSTPSPQDYEIINFIGFTALHDSNLGY